MQGQIYSEFSGARADPEPRGICQSCHHVMDNPTLSRAIYAQHMQLGAFREEVIVIDRKLSDIIHAFNKCIITDVLQTVKLTDRSVCSDKRLSEENGR